jgi:hypothetical protein
MKVPREKLQGLPSSSTSPYISVSDFEFVEDALLVIIEDKFILRIGGLEGAWLDEGTLAAYNIYTLSYSISTGNSSLQSRHQSKYSYAIFLKIIHDI